MIENNELGLKVAENKEEAFWNDAKKKCETSIFNAEKEIEINKNILELCEAKIKKED